MTVITEAPGNDSFTKLLLHFDAPNGVTSFVDYSASGQAFSINAGSPVISNRLSKFGGSALDLGTAANSLITCPNSADFDFSNSNFTIDFWLEPGASGGGNTMFNDFALTNGFFLGSSSTLAFFQAFSASPGVANIASYTATVALSANTLAHFAYVRNGTSFFIFLNGVSLALTVGVAIGSNTIPASGQPLFIGSSGVPPRTLDEVRVSKGIARWTSNFTPNPCSYG